MAEPIPQHDPVTGRSMSGALLVSSILLLLSLFWALYDEFYGLRPWKDYQERFAQVYGKFLDKAIADQTAKMLGQEDPFSRAMIESQLKQLDQQFDALLETGIPEESRAYMGMMGFQVKINMHGDVLGVEQPGAIGPEDEGE